MGIIGIIIFVGLPIYIILNNFKSKKMICKECGHTGKLIKQHKGSFLIEIVLWCCFIIPGIIYSLWRSTNRFYQCPECLSQRVIPLNSPEAEKITK